MYKKIIDYVTFQKSEHTLPKHPVKTMYVLLPHQDCNAPQPVLRRTRIMFVRSGNISPTNCEDTVALPDAITFLCKKEKKDVDVNSTHNLSNQWW